MSVQFSPPLKGVKTKNWFTGKQETRRKCGRDTMLYALNDSGGKERAIPRAIGICPFCHREMIPKCGDINIWHWAHKAIEGCDYWHEPETGWHLGWKKIFPQGWTEVVISKDGKRHIADVRLPSGIVVEFQHSHISPEEIAIREVFYGKMIWVFDVQDCEDRLLLRPKDDYYTFRWKHAKKHIASVEKDIFLDVGDDYMFQLKKFYPIAPSGGWGYLVTKTHFVTQLWPYGEWWLG